MRFAPIKLRFFAIGLAALIVIAAGTLTTFRLRPELLPAAVDAVRGVVGPDIVAWIEDVAFQAQDQFNQLEYRMGGKPPELVALPTSEPALQPAPLPVPQDPAMPVLPPVDLNAAPPPPTPQAAHGDNTLPVPALPPVDLSAKGPDPAARADQKDRVILPKSGMSSFPATPVLPGQPPQQALQQAPVQSAIQMPLREGVWEPIARSVIGGAPIMSETVVRPDLARPYSEAIIVSIDLRRTSLHLVAGTQEPVSSVKVARPGLIPAMDARPGVLLAAFNGGFKAINGSFGMMVDGVTLLPPRNGLATLGFYRDGTVRIGTWGIDIGPSPDLVSWRQNCPPLVRGGRLNDAVNDDGLEWGRTIKNGVITWRSGMGLSADRSRLFYAVGDNLSAATLARALLAAGASDAMQLDINSFWERFLTYGIGPDGTLIGTKLIPAMAGDLKQFLKPDTRDFFYLAVK